MAPRLLGTGETLGWPSARVKPARRTALRTAASSASASPFHASSRRSNTCAAPVPVMEPWSAPNALWSPSVAEVARTTAASTLQAFPRRSSAPLPPVTTLVFAFSRENLAQTKSKTAKFTNSFSSLEHTTVAMAAAP